MTDSDQARSQGAFSPVMVAIINRAYETALDRLGIANIHSDRRAALAKCVMDLAGGGETDEQRLCERAIALVERDDKIRTRAQQIWEEEGRPDGRHDEHWRRASQDVGEPPAG